jgi:hypothetical protein
MTTPELEFHVSGPDAERLAHDLADLFDTEPGVDHRSPSPERAV